MCSMASWQRVDHPHRQDQVEELGGVVGVGRLGQALGGVAQQIESGAVDPQLHAGGLQAGDRHGQHLRGGVAVHQQGLGGVADPGPLHLGVDDDLDGHLGIGVGVHVDVVVARGRVDHRHAGVLLQERLQLLAPARDDQVERALHLHQPPHLVAVGSEQRHRPARHLGLDQGAGEHLGDDQVGAGGQAAAAQDHRVAALQAEGGRVGGDVGAPLVDHRHHAERHAPAHDVEAVGKAPAVVDLAHRVGQRGHGADALGHVAHPVLVEQQPVDQRPGRCGRAWRPPRRGRCRAGSRPSGARGRRPSRRGRRRGGGRAGGRARGWRPAPRR